MTKYEFEKACDSARLTKEIEDSSIITALDRIETGTTTDVWFKADLSGGDLITLGAVVASHVNEPLPENVIQTVSIQQVDADTGALTSTPKLAPDGWKQQYFETEFETCNSGSDSIHERSWLNVDLGYSSLKFFKASGATEVECTDQADIDSNCIRTDLSWMPPYDYAIKSGYVSQKSVPASNVYIWSLAVDLSEANGGPQVSFANGGINMTFVDARTKSGLDGVAASILYYSHPVLGDGAGTNRLRFVTRHAAGFKHRIQVVLEIFVP